MFLLSMVVLGEKVEEMDHYFFIKHNHVSSFLSVLKDVNVKLHTRWAAAATQGGASHSMRGEGVVEGDFSDLLDFSAMAETCKRLWKGLMRPVTPCLLIFVQF